MADTWIDVKLLDGFVLPYASGAEQSLGDLKPYWDDLAATYPDLRLDPGFAEEDVPVLADMVDTARMQGAEPPDPFAWYRVVCDAADAEGLTALLQALPFVEWAEPRQDRYPASRVAYGTNSETLVALQLRPAPRGVDARYAWRVPGGTGRGVRVADLEHGWNTAHEDLATARITPFSVFGVATQAQKYIDHGTSAMGVVLASDNGGGIVGITPDADGYLVTDMRADGQGDTARALRVAGNAARPGGVVLIELASARPWMVHNDDDPALPVELSRQVQTAIELLVFFGITVVEPAGNAGVDMDNRQECDHFNPVKASYRDSLAIMVGGAIQDRPAVTPGAVVPPWKRGSSFGARVDCFADFDKPHAPYDNAAYPYRDFGGTSGASAVIAGVVCAIQGMCAAARDGQCLSPTDIRALFRNSKLCTPAGPDPGGGIGGMPNLRKIAAYMGWPRILPAPAAVPVAGDSAIIVQLGADDRLSLRTWSALFGLGPELPQPPGKAFELSDAQPAVLLSLELAPLLRTVFEVLITGADGSLRYYYWDTLGNTGDIARLRTPIGTLAPGYDLAAGHPVNEITAVAGITPNGRLVVVDYDATVMGDHDFSDPVDLDALSTYRRTPGPVMVVRKPGTLDVVAIDDGGALRWVAGVPGPDGYTTFWHEGVAAQSEIAMQPGVKPGLAGNLGGVAAVAVGTDGLLYACGFGLQPLLFEALTPVGLAPAFAQEGQVGLAMLPGDTLVVAAVSVDGLLHAAFLSLTPGAAWTPLITIDAYTSVSPLAGATVVTQGERAMVFAVLPDGRPCRADFIPGTGWSSLVAG
ncbi:S8 family serine peptidase [Cupriavidus sp. RAF12]|uniref:S8 family serine peptidase n=1 Tax=Cupriavidus sp. RAF12 TaxID=3233050 RepID=UPI003F8E599C